MFAIIATGGKQLHCEIGKEYFIEKIAIDETETLIFDQVLMIDDQIGAPFLKNAQVHAEIIKHDKAKKIIVFKYKPKKNSKTKYGHRQPYTKIKITAILLDATITPAPKKKVVPAEQSAPSLSENATQKQITAKKVEVVAEKQIADQAVNSVDKVKPAKPKTKTAANKTAKTVTNKAKTAAQPKKATNETKVETALGQTAIYDHKNLTVKIVNEKPAKKATVKKKSDK